MVPTLMTPSYSQNSASKVEPMIPETEHPLGMKETEPKAADPINIVEMAVEIAVERTRTTEALRARDAAVNRLVDAHEALRAKSAALEILQQKSRAGTPLASESSDRTELVRMKDEIARLERTIVELRIEIRLLKESAKNSEAPPGYEDGTVGGGDPRASPASDEPADMVAARNAVLAALPLPDEVPDDTLSPLNIPPPLTLQEFISTLSGPLRSSLTHYRLFYASTTHWCPEREEHGYFYVPVFKCNTNPRVATAHRWSAVDVIARMSKPTECFFNKDGIWYYAGVYKAFRLADLTTKEWAELPLETTQAIVKDTIAARKNTSPQNVYEITQLYAAGALRAACVGLQCVGFNNAMYAALLEQARAFAQSKWAAAASVGMGAVLGAGVGVGMGTGVPGGVVPGVGVGVKPSSVPTAVPIATAVAALGSATGAGVLGSGSAWNASSKTNATPPGAKSVVAAALTCRQGVEDVAAGVAAMNLGRRSQNGHGYENENVPVSVLGGEAKKR
ncbi:hypothetical protein H0H81_008360 [Sphagnurus paluster]|uniref:DUF6697 domain-containing protein n=1 Tax=Sphagnurus paluster TaxID=117069 RepID=A0A9P7FQJ2_9AGAR|nr:hypothetical protein H0H81_008360 [Sphagnurus paluster]